MTQAKVWWQGVRPRTLGAGLVPVLVGTAVSGHLIWWRFAAAFIVGGGLQIGVNLANDYFDGIKGVDTEDRMGPPRLTQSGAASPRSILLASLLALGAAAVAGLALALATSPVIILIVGACALLAALLYSGGPRPYAGLGLGELMVFLFFGVVATCGSAYVMVETIPAGAWWCGAALGLLAVAILLANNLRDIPTDGQTGKRTLAVRVGDATTRRVYRITVIASFAVIAVGALVHVYAPRAGVSPWALLGLAAWVPAIKPMELVGTASGRELIPVLIATARVHAAFGLLMAVGLFLSLHVGPPHPLHPHL
ncbi:MAG: 1,4-dihydroxy-2-naphthoate polyprenyltransferase [Actinomycetota bacterium]|nr:1,4-dihydroxy-2-naphthoate polyprenyltransferase [Actinomycetota bacterium]